MSSGCPASCYPKGVKTAKSQRKATWEDVRRIALALPETFEKTSYGNAAWNVAGKSFVWERPLRKSDLAALGSSAPTGPILGVITEDLEMKEATPHFNGYDVIVDAWLSRAPQRAADGFLKRGKRHKTAR